LSDILFSHYKDKSENSKEKEIEVKATQETKYIRDYENKVRDLLSQNEYINFDLFLDSLAVTSTFVRYNENFNELDKVSYKHKSRFCIL
jgi:hypothetical protein